MRRRAFAALLPLCVAAAPAGAEGPKHASDAAAPRGRAVFEAHCAACHALEPGRAGMPGPGLAGLGGRRVAGDPEFDYSPALREGAAGGQVWDAARLERFLADPEAMFPGLWMGGSGLRSAAERAAVARFLAGGGG